LGIVCSIAAFGQATGPATSATTRPATRQVLVVPPGFQVVKEGGRAVVCRPEDLGWVKKGLAGTGTVTRPTTMPADILARVKAKREGLVRQVVTELALKDPAGVAKTFDEDLAPVLEKYDSIRQPIFYLATTKAALKRALLTGWENPRFYYNRAADDVMTNTAMTLTAEREPDDLLLPVLVQAETTPDERAKLLGQAMEQTEAAIARETSTRSQVVVQAAMGHMVMQQAVLPLKLKRDQEWFGYGVAGWLSVRYAAELTGAPPDQLLREMTYEPQRSIVRSGPLDLLHPTDTSALRPGYVPFHEAALRRKAIEAVDAWVKKGGGVEVIAKALEGMRAGTPADGEGVVRLIKEKTGVDVGDSLRPKAGG
jgi:hypothetical protein